MRIMQKEQGFTLIELLVAVAIIGILSMIAIPQFNEYRRQGFDARAQSDLRNIMTAQEAYFADTELYTNSIGSLVGFGEVSDGVVASIASDGPGDGWGGLTYHPSGDHTYCYDSQAWPDVKEVVGQGAVGDCADVL